MKEEYEEQKPVSFYSEEGLKGDLVINSDSLITFSNPDCIIVGVPKFKEAALVEDIYNILRELNKKGEQTEYVAGYNRALLDVHIAITNLTSKEEVKDE